MSLLQGIQNVYIENCSEFCQKDKSYDLNSVYEWRHQFRLILCYVCFSKTVVTFDFRVIFFHRLAISITVIAFDLSFCHQSVRSCHLRNFFATKKTFAIRDSNMCKYIFMFNLRNHHFCISYAYFSVLYEIQLT